MCLNQIVLWYCIYYTSRQIFHIRINNLSRATAKQPRHIRWITYQMLMPLLIAQTFITLCWIYGEPPSGTLSQHRINMPSVSWLMIKRLPHMMLVYWNFLLDKSVFLRHESRILVCLVADYQHVPYINKIWSRSLRGITENTGRWSNVGLTPAVDSQKPSFSVWSWKNQY